MFDKKGTGTINFDEFGAVWKYVTDWQQCFRSFDRDGSGNISKDELKTAITTFGYRCVKKKKHNDIFINKINVSSW